MGIRLNCKCGRSLHLRDDLSGCTIRCPQCRKTLQVPDSWLEDTSADMPFEATAASRGGRRSASGPGRSSSSFSIWRVLVGLGTFVTVTIVLFSLSRVRPSPEVGSSSEFVYGGTGSESAGASDYGTQESRNSGFNASVGSPASASSTGLQPGRVPVPPFSGLSNLVQRFPGGHTMYSVRALSGKSTPGGNMQMFVYLPSQRSGPAELPCVLVAPAGTILLTGNDVSADYHKEVWPYVEAGFVVVRYSLDGAVDDMDDPAQLEAGVQAFMAAEGGTVNGRNALEFVLQDLPQVNPRRIFVAGHSSAGTVALCMAAVEPRLAGCIAYAACADPEERLRDALLSNGPGYDRLMQFLAKVSPMKHARDIKCPVMIFHARDDSNVPYSEASVYVEILKLAGIQTDFVTAASGDHYQPMIDEGIPAAIRWIQQH